MIHEERGRAESFGAAAEVYDRFRPSYPEALIDALVADAPRRVLDVGCGTGLAGRLFVRRGCDVLGVEADARMAELARSHGLRVDVGLFEEWEPPAEPFDLVVCGQAWHWLDPAIAPAKVGSVLREGGRFGAFWNLYHHEPDVLSALRGVYEVVAPQVLDGSLALGTSRDLREEQTAALGFGLFESVEWRSLWWERRCSADAWVAELMTHSDHAALEPDVRSRLLESVSEVVSELGGDLVVRHETILLTGLRVAAP